MSEPVEPTPLEPILRPQVVEKFRDLLLGRITDAQGNRIDEYLTKLQNIRNLVHSRESLSRSVVIDYNHLAIEVNSAVLAAYPTFDFNNLLSMVILNNPSEVLPELDRHLESCLVELHGAEIIASKPFYVRISNVDPDIKGLEMIRSDKNEKLIEVVGTVIRSRDPQTVIVKGRYKCERCNTSFDFEQPYVLQYTAPPPCNNPACPTGGRGNRSVVPISGQSIFVDYQQIFIQDEPNSVSGSRKTRVISAIIRDDLVDYTRPGDKIRVTGILKPSPSFNIYQNAFIDPTYHQFLYVSSITLEKNNQNESTNFAIAEFHEKVDTEQKGEAWWKEMIRFIGTGIKGSDHLKEAVLLQMFSGVKIFNTDGTHRRDKINVLFIGDPGTGKCVEEATIITDASGESKSIKEWFQLYDSAAISETEKIVYNPDFTVPSFDGEKIIWMNIHFMYEQKIRESMITLTTESGKKITTTHAHKFYQQSINSNVGCWTKCEDLKINDFIGVALRVLEGESITFEKIVQIEIDSVQDRYVYDLSIASTHNFFIQNGILCHNSTIGQSIEAYVDRYQYVSTQSATAAGTTAAVTKEGNGPWMVTAGAVVLADNGICVIDEFEKSKKEDITRLHEQMEHGRLTVRKADISQTLNARCDLLAIANPTNGRFDSNTDLKDNVKGIPPSIFSRFDLIFIIKDNAAQDVASMSSMDKDIADFVLSSVSTEPIITQREQEETFRPTEEQKLFFKEYVRYAKRFADERYTEEEIRHGSIAIRLSPDVARRLSQFYVEARHLTGDPNQNNAVPLTRRYVETLIRLTTARAKAMLRDVATMRDAEVAINLLRISLDQTLRDENGNWDANRVEIGTSTRNTSIGSRTYLVALADLMTSDNEDEGVGVQDFTAYIINNIAQGRDREKEAKKALQQLIRENWVKEVGGVITMTTSGRQQLRQTTSNTTHRNAQPANSRPQPANQPSSDENITDDDIAQYLP